MKERYNNLDGLRAISCLCIIGMHIKANADYQINSWLYTIVIGYWGHLVALFLMISGFGMFCGYYERFKNGEINLNAFYSKRYKKILPFFIILILIDVIMDRSLEHVIQGFTEATLVFGLLPNNQPDVIGVCWTLGVIFLFYMLFPFAVYLCWNKRRAIVSFVVSFLISIFCSVYYFTDKFVIDEFVPRHNFLYCAPWILAGGLVYLFRNEIKALVQQYKFIWLMGCLVLDVIWHIIPGKISGIDIWMIKNLILYLPWLMYAISVDSNILSNKVMKFLSGISLELYLAQMVIFRAVEKVHMLYIFGYGWISFILVWIIVVLGLIIFINVWKYFWNIIQRKTKKALIVKSIM